MQNLITQNSDGSLTVSSLVVAELFNRRHGDVLRSIDRVNAQLSDIKNKSKIDFVIGKDFDGRKTRTALLTEEQFLIAMPFIGGEKSFEGQVLLVQEFIRLRSEANVKNRHLDAIRSLLLLDAPLAWEKLYPDSFFIAIMNLYGHKFISNRSTPMYCANVIRHWVYDIVLPDELNREIDSKRGLEKKHTWFTKDNGRETLAAQIGKVEMIARMSESRADFEANCARAFLSAPLQLTVFKAAD